MYQRVGNWIRDDERAGRCEKANPNRVEEDAGIERLQQRREIVEREAPGLEGTGHMGAQAVLQHGRHGCKKAECAKCRGRDKDPQKGLRLHRVDLVAARRRTYAAQAAHQFMMFSANHLRHSAVFSARNLWSMMMAWLFHCSGVENTPGSLAISGLRLAFDTTGLPFLRVATSACMAGSNIMLMNL